MKWCIFCFIFDDLNSESNELVGFRVVIDMTFLVDVVHGRHSHLLNNTCWTLNLSYRWTHLKTLELVLVRRTTFEFDAWHLVIWRQFLTFLCSQVVFVSLKIILITRCSIKWNLHLLINSRGLRNEFLLSLWGFSKLRFIGCTSFKFHRRPVILGGFFDFGTWCSFLLFWIHHWFVSKRLELFLVGTGSWKWNLIEYLVLIIEKFCTPAL